jgi:N-acetylglucosaminyldiphosphoundecaprenol N-acetyl-beta-D-mannosaminyltransferase
MSVNKIFPVNIDDISLGQVVDMTLSGNLLGYIVTPNVDHMCRIYKSQSFRDLYSGANLVVCDSRILQYLSYLSKSPIVNVVRGSDLIVTLLKKIDSDEEIVVVGSDDRFSSQIKDMYGLKNVFCYVPPMGFISNNEEIDRVVDQVGKSKGRIVLMAVGSPQQEIMSRKLIDIYPDKLFICCGNAVNFAVGNVSRSPRWMSDVGLEWLYRCMVEPKRMIPRYLKNVEIFWLYLFSKERSDG